MAFFDFLKGKKSTAPTPGSNPGQGGAAPITLTAINLRLGGDIHSLPGKDVQQVFEQRIPFKNMLGNGLLPGNLKGPDITVSNITVDKPFELVKMEPALPVNIPYLSSTNFTLKIKGPEGSYNGPLVIKFDTSSKDNVDINVARIVLVHGDRRAEVEGSTFNMNIKKDQVFRKDIQLYKVMSYGETVNSIELSKPFDLAECETKLPFKLDKKDSYIITLFIRCPEFNYAGEMEIKFK